MGRERNQDQGAHTEICRRGKNPFGDSVEARKAPTPLRSRLGSASGSASGSQVEAEAERKRKRKRKRKRRRMERRRKWRRRRKRRLDVVIQGEFVWVRAQPDGVGFVAALVIDEGFDQLFGEYVALQQERVVLLQTAQRLFQRCGHGGDV